MPEVIRAFLGCEEIADIAQGFDELVEGPCADAAQELLEFGECHFDGVQVRTVRWQVEKPAAALSEGPCGAGIFVRAEVVENDDGSALQGRGKLGLDIGGESLAVHRARQDPRGDEGIGGQPRDEGLGAPPAEGCGGVQTLTFRGAAPAFWSCWS